MIVQNPLTVVAMFDQTRAAIVCPTLMRYFDPCVGGFAFAVTPGMTDSPRTREHSFDHDVRRDRAEEVDHLPCDPVLGIDRLIHRTGDHELVAADRLRGRREAEAREG